MEVAAKGGNSAKKIRVVGKGEDSENLVSLTHFEGSCPAPRRSPGVFLHLPAVDPTAVSP